MDYKTAKKLKDAGFPQNTTWYYLNGGEVLATKVLPQVNFDEDYKELGTPSGAWWTEDFNDEYSEGVRDFISAPTLSELIDACGGEFVSLTHHRNGGIESHWTAEQWIELMPETPEEIFLSSKKGGIIESKGKTPEEAVANLWLKLNE